MASRIEDILRRHMAALKDGEAEDDPAPPEETDESRFTEKLHKLRVPKKYLGVKRETVLHPDLAGWAGEPWCVTLLGKAGTGKTWQAVRLLAAVYEADERRLTWAKYRSFYVDWSTSIERIKREFGTPDDGVTYDELCNAEILLIDDFGAERETVFSMDKASLILRARYNEQRPTIVTTNFATLEPIFNAEPRIASRLSEGIVLPILGRDRRQPLPLPTGPREVR